MRLYADSPRCSGCRACQLACSLHLWNENNPKKSALAIIAYFPDPGTFKVRVCTQCGDCADACPTGAILQNEHGAYYINPDDCTGCLACQEACPEEVIFAHRDREAPFKCDACGDCIAVCGMDVLSLR